MTSFYGRQFKFKAFTNLKAYPDPWENWGAWYESTGIVQQHIMTSLHFISISFDLLLIVNSVVFFKFLNNLNKVKKYGFFKMW